MKTPLFLLTFFLSTLFISADGYCDVKQMNADIRAERIPVRGANLGSWLVLENWMVPEMWSTCSCDMNNVEGQWQFEQCCDQNGQDVSQVLENHWSTWVTEQTFQQLADSGVNAVRIPIGWWMIYDPEGGANHANLNYYVTPTAYTVGGLKYLDMAFDWAEQYGVGIFIDMHAAPGSQNGDQDSSPAVTGQVYWDKYPANQGETVDSIGLYADRYKNRSALLGFHLLNEPAVETSVLQDYYLKAHSRILQSVEDVLFIIMPINRPWEDGTGPEWTGFMNFPNVWMSIHYYYCFGGPWNATDPESVISYAKNQRMDQIRNYVRLNPKPLIGDEWSACGVPDGYEYQFVQAELEGFDLVRGWAFWAWHNPDGGAAWDLQQTLANGWIRPEQMSHVC